MLGKRKNNLKIAARPSGGTPRKSRRVELLARKGLMPPDPKDDEQATSHFKREFRSRFAPNCPQFFTGSLENAVCHASGRHLEEEKLLAIYIHHDGSMNGDRFSIQLLCSELAMDIISQDYLVFGWDLTEETNRKRFMTSAASILDRSTMYDVSRAHKDRYPMLLIVRCRNSRCRLQKRVEGNTTREDFIETLSREADYAQQERKVSRENESQRAIRQSILDQQKAEYEESLRTDREKERQRLEKETDLKRISDCEVRIEKLKMENNKLDKDKRKYKRMLPREPITSKQSHKLRFRKPTGDGYLKRSFSPNNKLKDVLHYAASEGFPQSKYRIISLCPSREISSMNPTRPLSAIGLAQQETLIIEEK